MFCLYVHVGIYVAMRRSVNAEMILIHESNSKNTRCQHGRFHSSRAEKLQKRREMDKRQREAETPEKRRIRLDRQKSYREKRKASETKDHAKTA